MMNEHSSDARPCVTNLSKFMLQLSVTIKPMYSLFKDQTSKRYDDFPIVPFPNANTGKNMIDVEKLALNAFFTTISALLNCTSYFHPY